MPGDPLRDPLSVLPVERVPRGVMRDLYTLWLTKWAPTRLPARRDFDPIEIPRLLPHMMVLDVEHEPLRFRIRLVGTAIVEATGMDTTGRYFDANSTMSDAHSRCQLLVETRLPHFHADLPLKWSSRNFRTYSVLGLPLAADGRTVDKVLGALIFA